MTATQMCGLFCQSNDASLAREHCEDKKGSLQGRQRICRSPPSGITAGNPSSSAKPMTATQMCGLFCQSNDASLLVSIVKTKKEACKAVRGFAGLPLQGSPQIIPPPPL